MTYAVLGLLYGPLLVRRCSVAAQNNTLLVVVTAVVFVKSIILSAFDRQTDRERLQCRVVV